MAKPPPSGPEGDSGPDSNNKSDDKSSTPRAPGSDADKAGKKHG